jgi:2-dehydropantoate 2-reductase
VRHAVLGVGAVGGLIATVLADAGDEVFAVVRPPLHHPRRRQEYVLMRPDGTSLRGWVTEINSLPGDSSIGVLWIATKAQHLCEALQRVAGSSPRAVIPLLNGFEHIVRLEAAFGSDAVIPATIAVEAERISPRSVRQLSPFVKLQIAARGEAAIGGTVAALRPRGVDLAFNPDETTLIWEKLVFLAPFAVTTSASGLTAGAIRADPHWRGIFEELAREVAAVAGASSASVSAEGAVAMLDRVSPTMTSSMHKDIAAGREPEIDAIAGAVIRRATSANVEVPLLATLERSLSGIKEVG